MSKIKQYVRHLAVVAAATLLAQCAWADKVIAINFNSTATSNTGGGDEYKIADGETMNVIDYTIPFAGWTQLEGASSSSAVTSLTEYDTEAGTTKAVTGVSLTWSSANTWAWRNDTIQSEATYKYLEGYLDDGGNGAKVNISGIPYENGYDVIVFMVDDGTAKVASPTINGKMYSWVDGAVKVVTTATNWGAGQQTTAAYGKNALRIAKQSGNLVIDSPRRSGRGAIAAIVLVEAQATIKDVECGDAYSISSAKDFTEDIVNLKFNAGATLTLDEAPARDFNIVSEGKVLVKGAALSAENLAKLANKTAGYIFRIEGDLSEGTTLDYGAGTYSFENAKVSAQYGADYKVLVLNGDTFHLADRSGMADGRTSLSLDVQGGTVTIGKADGNGSFWYGTGAATTYNQTDGEVTCTATGTGTSGSGNGLLLGWSGALASMNVSGGTFSVPNSSLNFWSNTTTLNVSGGAVKAKGVFRGDGNNHMVVLSGNGVFELGSIGWTTVGLTLNGGTFKAYENTTMAGPITMGGAANIEVPANVELKLTGSVTGEGAIIKKGEGILNVGTARPTMDVKEGSVKIVATPSELVAGVLTLTVTPDATPASKDKVSVWDSEGNEVEITGVSIEGTTITITLKTLPSIDKDTSISELKLDPAAAGLIVVEGGETEEEAITITFDAELPEGVSMEINGFVKFAAAQGIEIPYAKMTFGEDATLIFDVIDGFDIPTGATVIAGTASGTITNAGTLTIGTMTSGTINNTGTLNVTGDCTYTLTNTGTLNVKSGVSTVSRGGDQSIKGTINIEADAEFVNKSGDAVSYGDVGTTVNVYGTLTMADNTRWTVGGNSKINLYGGCTVTGATTGNGAFDLFRNGEIITVNRGADESISAVTINAKLRPRNGSADNASEIKIASGMTLAVTGGFGYADRVGRVKRTGDGHFTGTIPLSDVTLIYTTGSVGNIPAHFVVSGTSTIEWHGNGSDPVCSNDSKTDPFITVNSGATLKIYGHDYSGWNGALRDTGWIVNNGTLVFENGSGSRFWREHIVMGDGSTVKIDNGNRALLMYGGAGAEDNCQFMLPEGSATIQSGTEGDKAVLYFGNDGSGGWADNDAAKKASGFSVGADATLTISCPIKGDQAIAKHGAGTLVIENETSSYSGAVTLNAGTIVSAIALNVTCGDANMKLETTTGEGVTTYSLVQRDPTEVTLVNFVEGGYTINGATVAILAADSILIPADCAGDAWHPVMTELVKHDVKVLKSMNWKASVNRMTIGGSEVVVYLYANESSSIASGANVDGDGSLQLSGEIPVNGAATISCAIIGDGKLKLMEGATLTCAELTEGKVISGVEGKVVKYADGKYTLVDAVQELPGEEYFSGEGAAAYKAWALATGVNADTDPENAEDLAIAYSLGVTGTTTVADALAAAKDEVEDLIAEIDCSKLAGEDGLTAALATLNETLATKGLKATLTPVPSTEIETTAKLYRLVINAIPANTAK